MAPMAIPKTKKTILQTELLLKTQKYNQKTYLIKKLDQYWKSIEKTLLTFITLSCDT